MELNGLHMKVLKSVMQSGDAPKPLNHIRSEAEGYLKANTPATSMQAFEGRDARTERIDGHVAALVKAGHLASADLGHSTASVNPHYQVTPSGKQAFLDHIKADPENAIRLGEG